MNHITANWTSLKQIKNLLLKRWTRGYFYKRLHGPDCIFPFKLSLKGPTTEELSTQFSAVRDWINQFTNEQKELLFSVQWRPINHRVLGKNQIPHTVLFDSVINLAKFIGKVKEYDLYTKTSHELVSTFQGLEQWVQKYPLKLLACAPNLTKLMQVLEWMLKNKRPGIYLRQISLKGIDTKFIESSKGLLSEWLDILLPLNDIDINAVGVKGFEQRYGFVSKPQTIRFRILDKKLYIKRLSDLTIRIEEFCKLKINIDKVFVTENDINGLAFPMIDRALVIFGRGYGFDYLKEAHWLFKKKIWYWGDIDTHGFSILSQFRNLFPQTESLLMDRVTLFMHQNQWVNENSPLKIELPNLTKEEKELYHNLCNNHIGKSVRLEQELISWEHLHRRLQALGMFD